MSRESRKRPAVKVLAAAALIFATLMLTAVPAMAQTDPGPPPPTDSPPADSPPTDTTPTIGNAMEGKLAGVTATARRGFAGGDFISVFLLVTNTSSSSLRLEVPRGTLLETEDETEQTAVIAGPQDEAEIAVGINPALVVPPGQHEFALDGYCAQELDSGPNEIVPMFYVGVAGEPLPTVLHNAVATDASHQLTQAAVWWVTDNPVVPVDPALAPLLADVDTEAFAAAPTQVVPDEGYTPMFEGGQYEIAPPDAFGGDTGTSAYQSPTSAGRSSVLFLAIFLAFIAGIAIIGFLIARSGSRNRVPAVVRPTQQTVGFGSPAGWYPDPNDRARLRWFDGQRWTDHHN